MTEHNANKYFVFCALIPPNSALNLKKNLIRRKNDHIRDIIQEVSSIYYYSMSKYKNRY